MAEPPRSKAQRRSDALARLERDVDCWVASADADGNAYLVPLSYHWDGETLVLATPLASPTAANLIRAGRARLGLGPTRDVLLVDGTVEAIAREDAGELGDEHARTTGFDPRAYETAYVYLRIRPTAIQAWREANELRGRQLMRDGVWLGD